MAAADGSNWNMGVNSCCFCGAGNAKKCGGCLSVAYCGKECQVKDWKRGHKIRCSQLQAKRYQLASTPRAPSSPLVIVFSLYLFTRFFSPCLASNYSVHKRDPHIRDIWARHIPKMQNSVFGVKFR